MGRKKKKRKQRRSEQPATARSVPRTPAEAPGVSEAVDEAPLPASQPEAPGASTRAAPHPAGEVVADLDLEDDTPESYDSLVAAVAGMQDPGSAAANDGSTGAADEREEIHDLDDDGAGAGGLHTLIAQVERGAPAEARTDDPDDDVDVIDLDDDAPAAPARRAAPTVTTSPDMERLARAAAAGAVDDPEPPPIPLDLYGDVSTPESRARLLAEALAHAEHKEARYRVPLADTRRAARWKSAVASILLVLAAAAAVAPPAWVRPQPPAQLSDAARARGLRLALLLQAQQIEAHRIRTHQLPASLADLPVTLDGVRYARSGRSFQLVAFLPDGTPVVYDAAEPGPGFRALEATLHPVVP